MPDPIQKNPNNPSPFPPPPPIVPATEPKQPHAPKKHYPPRDEKPISDEQVQKYQREQRGKPMPDEQESGGPQGDDL